MSGTKGTKPFLMRTGTEECVCHPHMVSGPIRTCLSRVPTDNCNCTPPSIPYCFFDGYSMIIVSHYNYAAILSSQMPFKWHPNLGGPVKLVQEPIRGLQRCSGVRIRFIIWFTGVIVERSHIIVQICMILFQ